MKKWLTILLGVILISGVWVAATGGLIPNGGILTTKSDLNVVLDAGKNQPANMITATRLDKTDYQILSCTNTTCEMNLNKKDLFQDHKIIFSIQQTCLDWNASYCKAYNPASCLEWQETVEAGEPICIIWGEETCAEMSEPTCLNWTRHTLDEFATEAIKLEVEKINLDKASQTKVNTLQEGKINAR